MPKSQFGRISQRLQNETTMQIQKDEDNMRRLLPEASPERRKYPESEFRRHFLPVFSGEAYTRLPPGYTSEQLANDASRYWMQVAGGPNAEVEVINHDGSTAFVVPALCDTSVLNVAQPADNPGLRMLNHNVLQKVQSLPDAAKRELVNGLDRKLAYMTAAGQGDKRDAVTKITAMRAFYNLPEPAPEDGKPKGDGAGLGFMGEMQFD